MTKGKENKLRHPFDDCLLPLTYEISGESGQNCMSSIFLS